MKGIAVSPGIAIGKARVIQKNAPVLTGVTLEDEKAIDTEIDDYKLAVQKAVAEMEAIKNNLAATSSSESLDILEAQIELVRDPQIEHDVLQKIKNERKNANDALIEVIQSVVQMFENMEDEYLRSRSSDFKDIGLRILKHLNQSSHKVIPIFADDTIIIAEDITPSDTITMDVKHIKGFATEIGGKTSHIAIIAKSREIPAVVGCGVNLKTIKNDDVIIIDGLSGLVVVNPGQEMIDDYERKRTEYAKKVANLKALKDIPSQTTDGIAVKLLANIANPEEMGKVFEYCGSGVGLLRTEVLFMGRNTFPTEEEQFQFYKKIAQQSQNLPVTIRTIDIGGDKQLPYFDLPNEANPFLGYRAIRICLDRQDIFMTQLKAILRASVFGNFRIMFPMIANIQEVKRTKEILEEAKKELLLQNMQFAPEIEVGIMIEIPSAAVTADILAKEVDFFSIGTNDLCQYTLAVDRLNEKIKDLYDPFNPGVLRLIHYVIEQAHRHNISVEMCGELAADPLATLLLLGMGLDEFSMNMTAIPWIKEIIIQSNMATAKAIYQKVMSFDSSAKILEYLQEVSK